MPHVLVPVTSVDSLLYSDCYSVRSALDLGSLFIDHSESPYVLAILANSVRPESDTAVVTDHPRSSPQIAPDELNKSKQYVKMGSEMSLK